MDSSMVEKLLAAALAGSYVKFVDGDSWTESAKHAAAMLASAYAIDMVNSAKIDLAHITAINNIIRPLEVGALYAVLSKYLLGTDFMKPLALGTVSMALGDVLSQKLYVAPPKKHHKREVVEELMEEASEDGDGGY